MEGGGERENKRNEAKQVNAKWKMRERDRAEEERERESGDGGQIERRVGENKEEESGGLSETNMRTDRRLQMYLLSQRWCWTDVDTLDQSWMLTFRN